jgi:hypothetical protein
MLTGCIRDGEGTDKADPHLPWQTDISRSPDYIGLLEGPFYWLEAEGSECVLADAGQVKNLPGRPKRDPADSRWLAACFEHGPVTSGFVATGVPGHPAAHPLPAGPDRRTHHGEAAHGKAEERHLADLTGPDSRVRTPS